ncbi:hypothetical protein GRF59_06145 [Paenibacillus sp. HJL G12]|uniref:Copper amine oxidase-like N-terminal domain-containing protein n=1 Tax=Paenibacillus dendrobii TaxID=2691084 RepID=A0A7X3LFN8_9BACL|nr:hypothetical protein [Paenibacillus dendrobii]MWV43207.1 hypothetical protein [Paenibacillus dendrobii]
MKKRFKIMIAACSAFVLLTGSAMAVTAGPRIFINKAEYANTFLKVKIEKGTAMVSLRAIVEQLKGEVTYKDNNIYVTMPEASHLANQVNGFQNALQAETPEEAAQTWARGVQKRSGPLQYAVMTPAMQQSTKQEFEDNFWVTGGSSPHMGKVTNMVTKPLSSNKVQISFEYPLIVSGGVFDTGKASLTIETVNGPAYDYWAISEIYLKDPGDTGLMIGAKTMTP